MLAELSAAFSGVEAFAQLGTLVFLEIILGIDNIVFISLTADRLDPARQHLGRRLGLAAAMCTRIALLFTLGWIMQLTQPLYTLHLGAYVLPVTGKNIILLCGGIYLIFKGVVELREMLLLTEEREAFEHPDAPPRKRIGLTRAVVTIALMDIVFSFDSVITAVGLVDHVIIAAIAIIVAILFMMSCADMVAGFITRNPEIKLLALFFILTIGVLLVSEFFGLEINEWYIYAAMFFTLLVTLLQMLCRRRLCRTDPASALRAGKPCPALLELLGSQPQFAPLVVAYLLAAAVLLLLALCQVGIDPGFVLVPLLFSLLVTLLQKRYAHNLDHMLAEIAAHKAAR